MGDAIINTLRALSVLQKGVLVILLLAAAGAVYGVYFWSSGSGQDALEENQQLIPVSTGNLVDEVSISGSLLFPTKEVLKFGVQGVVEEITVEEGDTVEAGQIIGVLDLETRATLRLEIDDARVKLKEAQEAVTDLQTPYSALDLVQAEERIIKAMVQLKDAEEALDELLNPPSLAENRARAEANVEKASLDLAQANDALSDLTAEVDKEDIARAASKIDSLEVALSNVQRDLTLAEKEWADNLANGWDNMDQAFEDYSAVVLRWLGAELSREDAEWSPEQLLQRWGTDLETLFTPVQSTEEFLNNLGGFIEDPETPWSELVVGAWTGFFPDSFVAVCDNDAIIPHRQKCISRELDDAWEEFYDAGSALDTLQIQSSIGLAKAESAVTTTYDSFVDAKLELEGLFEEPDSLDLESARLNIILAQMSLDDAKEQLVSLDEEPDPLDVTDKEKDVEVARAALAQANEDLLDLQAAVDPLEVALRESRLASAEVALDAALSRLESVELVAPWSGTVLIVSVEGGDEVNVNSAAVEIVDPRVVEVDGIVDEIDVLSVRLGSQASVFMDALPTEVLTGVVSSIGSGATNQQGVVTYPVTVQVTVPGGLDLIEGLSAVAQVVIRQETGLLVPIQSVQGSFTQPTVLVWKDGVEEERPVTLGISDDFWTIVTAGLEEGEQVVLQIPEFSQFQFGPGGGAGAGFRAFPRPGQGR